MKKAHLLHRLAENYGLLVRTQYHVQIETPNGMHNIWFPQDGGIKFQACGHVKWRWVSPEQLLKELSSYNYDASNLAYMQRLSTLVKKLEGKKGIYTDAGFFGGKAKVAIIRMMDDGYDIAVRDIEVASSADAEMWGVIKAAEMYPGNEPIHTDCQEVSLRHPRAKWIPREANREADQLGNMRKT